ncbi:hypothetical protein [Streptomyces sp. NBC_01264]|uniref:hypothetical protein n=1 Tax=Streptomyces sp. NBC_01264 TaxID=2903804 RepID=UPI002255325E|nr:hypothetical protein [Streptomyces sp. NBC_01264]MCX4775490.1 hypothetical protein [Streptomyces sp. NBC_01264]
MTLVTVLILVAVAALVALLALAPSAPVRRNPFPGRRHRATHRRTTPRPGGLPHQRGLHHHTR